MDSKTPEERAALELFIAIRKARRAGVEVVTAMAAVTQGMCGISSRLHVAGADFNM